MNHPNPAVGLAIAAAVLLPVLHHAARAQEDETPAPERPRAAADLDPQAKHLFDKAMELMDYKQYERGLAMLNSIVRDNQGTILAHRAHMAMGKTTVNKTASDQPWQDLQKTHLAICG